MLCIAQFFPDADEALIALLTLVIGEYKIQHSQKLIGVSVYNRLLMQKGLSESVQSVQAIALTHEQTNDQTNISA